MVQKIRA